MTDMISLLRVAFDEGWQFEAPNRYIYRYVLILTPTFSSVLEPMYSAGFYAAF